MVYCLKQKPKPKVTINELKASVMLEVVIALAAVQKNV